MVPRPKRVRLVGSGATDAAAVIVAVVPRLVKPLMTEKEAKARKKELEGKEASYQPMHRRSWTTFIGEFKERALRNVAYKTRLAYEETISHFERLACPTVMSAITTAAIEQFALSGD